jgi:hypothetical protein
MKRNATELAAILSSMFLGAALAAPGPGPEAACNALAEQTRQAVVLKTQGFPVEKAIMVLSSQPVPGTVPADQASFFKQQLPGAARFAYMSGMSGDGTARFYLKQCRIGS